MTAALPDSIVDAILALAIGAIGQDSSNRFSLEGLTAGRTSDGALEVGIGKLAAASFRAASGPLTLEVGHLALHKLVAQVRLEAGRPRLYTLEAASAELDGVKIQGSLVFSPHSKGDAAGHAASGSWSLAPLAAANGTIRAEIVDAHLLFDADVTVPIRQGHVDFNEATVEHVGPDSRMGVSRLGLYVDAPNGRSYLHQFSAAPVAGVQYERRGVLPGPWGIADRGKLQLQAFGEALLSQARGGPALGFTEQTRQLMERTAVSGDVRLGDGRFSAPGVQADLAGRAEGRNVFRLHSEAVGRGLTVAIASLLVRNAALNWGDRQVGCDEIAGTLLLRPFLEGTQLRLAAELSNMKISGLRFRPAGS